MTKFQARSGLALIRCAGAASGKRKKIWRELVGFVAEDRYPVTSIVCACVAGGRGSHARLLRARGARRMALTYRYIKLICPFPRKCRVCR